MTATVRVLAFSGSLRRGSLNSRVVRVAGEGARGAGAEVTVIDLREYPLPVYDQDLEETSGIPDSARALKALFLEHDGLLISSPEYNGSLTAALKNAIDWVSRRDGDEASLACFRNKTAAIMSASPGGLGGLRGLAHLRTILSGIGVLVLAQQIAVPRAHAIFDDEGRMTDEARRDALTGLGAELAGVVGKLKA